MRLTILLPFLFACYGDNPASAEPAASGNSKTSPGKTRVVAIGDLHADLDRAKEVFKLAGLIDDKGAWIGGDATVVQTGDLTDRGEDGRQTLEFIRDVETKAKGKFITLIGNHEAMNVMDDLRYVHPSDTKSFGGAEKRLQAFDPGGEWYDWIMSHDVVVRVGDSLFAHGGVSSRFKNVTPKQLSKRVRDAIAAGTYTSELGEEGPMWYRGHLLADEALACAEIDKVLAAQKASRIVVGHTTQRTGVIASRCGGRIIGIDIGISDHYGANVGFLEILDGDVRAVYTDRVVDLPDADLPKK